MRRWWLKRFTREEIRELAGAIWTDAETVERCHSVATPPDAFSPENTKPPR
jgi:hypothetical protein